MALSIKSDKVDRLARELATLTGESMTTAIQVALEERLQRARGRAKPRTLRQELAAIRRRCSRLPVIDRRTPDEILGYEERGLPT